MSDVPITYAPDQDQFRGTCICGFSWLAHSFGAAVDLGQLHADLAHEVADDD